MAPLRRKTVERLIKLSAAGILVVVLSFCALLSSNIQGLQVAEIEVGAVKRELQLVDNDNTEHSSQHTVAADTDLREEINSSAYRSQIEQETKPVIHEPEKDNQPDYLSSKSIKQGSRSRSLIFLKAFKVGGTTLSTLLTSYAFNSNLKMAPINNWCRGRPLWPRTKQCIDLIGTNHPTHLPCEFKSISSPQFCNPAESFVMLRDPVGRLWSGYKHEIRIAKQSFPLHKFLTSESIVKTPSYFLLDKDADKAVGKLSDVHILFHHLYDESLVYMSMVTGMKLCDIIYPPCNKASWGATKCNQEVKLAYSKQQQIELQSEANRTGELRFYHSALKKGEDKLKSKEVRSLTLKFRRLQKLAMKKCSHQKVIDSIERMLKNHPYVSHDKAREKLYHYQTEKSNPLDPLTICLGWYCDERV